MSGDAKYFTTQKKGELYELKAELHSDKPQKRKDGVKTVMAGMTAGKDMSSLFPDVVQNMNGGDLEMKKLVYLYIMNYAKSSPEQANLVISAFQKDVSDYNPLIRALALRSMGSIRVDKIAEYMVEPVQRALRDDDPYVRKTGVMCVGKLYDINPEFVENMGFIDALRAMLSDANPMVVANCVATLTEITNNSDHDALKLNAGLVQKLLAALNECTEWGQVFILDALADYEPLSPSEARGICERVQLRLQSGNAAVVLSSVKIIVKCIEYVQDADFEASTIKRLAGPLVTLLSLDQELQYVTLRNIILLLQKYPDVMRHELKVFFVKYNDPIYIKMEKLDILVRIANDNNMSQVLAELKQYAQEVDVDFVRKSVKAIGRCAVKVESGADQCVETLSELIQTKVNYVVQEAIVVIRDIFRKYPNRYETIIGLLCENLDTLDEPEAKAAMVWIIGEYSSRIDNSDELLQAFADSFLDDPENVQLALLTATVKLFLNRPQSCQALVQKILTQATQEIDNPDLRDRGFIYWRLLSTDPATAKAVVLSDKPLISEETEDLEPTLLDELLRNIAMLASVYHKPPTDFLDRRLKSYMNYLRKQGLGGRAQPSMPAPEQQQIIQQPQQADLIGDLLDLSLDDNYGSMQAVGDEHNPFMQPVVDEYNPFAMVAAPVEPAPAMVTSGKPGRILPDGRFVKNREVWLTAQQGKGLEIQGTFSRRQGEIFMEMLFTNKGQQPLGDFAMMLNKNSFALTPAAGLVVSPSILMPGMAVEVTLPLSNTGPVQRMDPLNKLQVAVKTRVDVAYFDCMVPDYVLFGEDGLMERSVFLDAWRAIPDTQELTFAIHDVAVVPEGIEDRLRANNVYTLAKRNVDGRDLWYISTRYINNIWLLLELSMGRGERSATLGMGLGHTIEKPEIL